MPIKYPEPPADCLRVVIDVLATWKKTSAKASLVAKRQRNKKAIFPHLIYFAKLDHIIRRAGLRYSRPVAWRYFVGLESSPELSVVEVNLSRGGKHKFSMISEGVDMTPHHTFLRSMAERSEPGREVQFRLLRIPSLHIHAIWLKSPRRNADLIVPLISILGLLGGRIYPRAEFEGIIQAEAEARITDHAVFDREEPKWGNRKKKSPS